MSIRRPRSLHSHRRAALEKRFIPFEFAVPNPNPSDGTSVLGLGARARPLGIAASSLLALSCAGPLPDTCTELGTCARGDASLAIGDSGVRAEAGADAQAENTECDLIGDPKSQPCLLDDAYGVFVAPQGAANAAGDAGAADAGADGSKDHPFATIGEALAQLGSKTRIFVCNGAYAEQVSITVAVSVYGGLSCAAGSAGPAWSYVGQSAQVTAPPSAYGLFVTGVEAGSVTIEDMAFAAPDATAAGASSIAAFVASSSVRLERVALRAGNGAGGVPGADGTANPNYTGGSAPSGGAQVWGTIGGLFSPMSGGAGGVARCLLLGSSAGGDGGLGCASGPGVQGGLGTPGVANPEPPVTLAGDDGLPAGAALAADAGVSATSSTNDPGADGVPGEGGTAVPAQVYGVLSASGWVPSAGGDGLSGGPGQGGAGASDPLYGQCNVGQPSMGGGGGGAGGCGGAGGKGGGGGGGSIAMASIGSTLNLTDCALSTGACGGGGPGGAGQDGQAGGAGGDNAGASQLHAAGGAGGSGAGGSGGAGGTGGVSAGILASGSTIATDGPTVQNTRLGGPGAGGAAGSAGRRGSAGALGTGADGNAGSMGSPGSVEVLLTLM